MPQLLSSPVEINDIHIPFPKQHQGSDLLSAASFKNDDIYAKYRWEAQMQDWCPNLERRNSFGTDMAYAVSVLQGVADEASQMQKPN